MTVNVISISVVDLFNGGVRLHLSDTTQAVIRVSHNNGVKQ